MAAALEKARADGLATDRQFTINPNRDIWNDDRSAVHDEIIQEAYKAASDVPCEGTAIIVGGLGGAGKSTVLELHAGIDLTRYLVINPDDFKEELAKRGLTPKVLGLSPMETSTLVHEESSHLARQLALRALSDGKNIIWDITMSSLSSTARRITDLREVGYRRVDGVFVDIPVEQSLARAIDRHRRGHDLYLSGEGFGGRLLPADAIRSQTDPDYGSVNRRVFEILIDQFDNWSIYDNSREGFPPALIGSGKMRNQDRTQEGI